MRRRRDLQCPTLGLWGWGREAGREIGLAAARVWLEPIDPGGRCTRPQEDDCTASRSGRVPQALRLIMGPAARLGRRNQVLLLAYMTGQHSRCGALPETRLLLRGALNGTGCEPDHPPILLSCTVLTVSAISLSQLLLLHSSRRPPYAMAKESGLGPIEVEPSPALPKPYKGSQHATDEHVEHHKSMSDTGSTSTVDDELLIHYTKYPNRWSRIRYVVVAHTWRMRLIASVHV